MTTDTRPFRAAAPATPWKRRTRVQRLGRAVAPLLSRPGFALALLVVLYALAAAVVPQWLTHFDPYATSPAAKLTAPGAAHWFGTDELGRDLYTRVVYGASLSVQAALLAVGIALAGGLGLGVLAGFAGGRVDAALMRVIDVLLALPGLLLALAIVTAIGFGTVPVAIAVGVGIIPGFARTTRAEVLRVKTLPYVEAARLGGASWCRTLLRHILPNAWGPVAVLATLDFGAAILATAGLSFLGFGAAPPAAEWGTLIANGRHFLITAPWVSLLPGLFVVAVVFSLNHLARTFEEHHR
ncbi:MULTISPECIES: ABC transporter permease [unclassified Pseudomonas]|uniref:ABC transporter permease n=1 Tax=unclassified Pseudomonas TaxID=196821 RepID=UPI000A0C2239|nr:MULTISPECIES: ABC transporter permease [unclassified Pseudomonas]SMF19636.1 peptide/nickel transport system permease protein [Pseudomonas sp. LAIL14HWK12:I11]SMR77165.1 peptide/nickel transport system permease protein [Pseudomonas sp. LAIL14HWK12:I10]SOD03062.1 peptide/nickel transport system permease protein [Pseudomonas sp. LAIL14HWK12:I8]